MQVGDRYIAQSTAVEGVEKLSNMRTAQQKLSTCERGHIEVVDGRHDEDGLSKLGFSREVGEFVGHEITQLLEWTNIAKAGSNRKDKQSKRAPDTNLTQLRVFPASTTFAHSSILAALDILVRKAGGEQGEYTATRDGPGWQRCNAGTAQEDGPTVL